MPPNVSNDNYYPILPLVSSLLSKGLNDIRNKKNREKQQQQQQQQQQPITVMKLPFCNNNTCKKKSVPLQSLLTITSSMLVLIYSINFIFMFLQQHHHHDAKSTTTTATTNNHTETPMTIFNNDNDNSNNNISNNNINILNHHQQQLQKGGEEKNNNKDEQWVFYRSIQEQVTIHSSEVDVWNEYCHYNISYNDDNNNGILLRDMCNNDSINNSMRKITYSFLDKDNNNDTTEPQIRGTTTLLINNSEEETIYDNTHPSPLQSNHNYPLHCVSITDHTSHHKQEEKEIVLKSLDQSRNITAWDILIQRVDWPWAIMLILLWCFSSYHHTTTTTTTKTIQTPRKNFYHHSYNNTNNATWKHRMQWTMIYLIMVIIYKKIQSGNNGYWISTAITTIPSLVSFLKTTTIESYYAFTIVHPIDDGSSQLLLLSHIVTYWFQLGAWSYAKNIRQFLLFYIGYELVTSFCNEYLHHHDEMDIGIKCTRISFISTTKQYAIDDTIRAYLLPPIFVYLYLVPKLIIVFFFGK